MKAEDRELLVLAARAAGLPLHPSAFFHNALTIKYGDGVIAWNSLARDGDTMRLAATLHMDFRWDAHDRELRAACVTQGRLGHYPPGWDAEIYERYLPEEIGTTAPYRRAATRLAAMIGETTKTERTT